MSKRLTYVFFLLSLAIVLCVGTYRVANADIELDTLFPSGGIVWVDDISNFPVVARIDWDDVGIIDTAETYSMWSETDCTGVESSPSMVVRDIAQDRVAISWVFDSSQVDQVYTSISLGLDNGLSVTVYCTILEDPLTITLVPTGGGSTVSTSTFSYIKDTNRDLFMIFWIAFSMMCFTTWIIRGKK